MRTLVLLVHADPSVRPRYLAALGAAGVDADVVALVAPPLPNVAGGGMSSRYDALAQRCLQSGNGSAIKGLLGIYKAPAPPYDRIVLATYSAGYAFARHLSDDDLLQLDALCLIDSGHTSKDKDGTASDAGIKWLTEWAESAKDGGRVLVIGHTDVDPVTYASTTQVADEAVRLSGAELLELELTEAERAKGLVRRRIAAKLVVETWNRRAPKDAKLEHADALTVWGDELVALAASMAQGPSLDALLAPFKPLGGVARVVAGALSTLTHDELGAPSHGWRCSVAESIADAKKNGKWHPRGSDYKAKRGDVICGARLGEEPEQGGRGHYERIVAIEDGRDPTTCGGNEADQWIVDVYRWSNPAFRGVIEVDAVLGGLAADIALEQKKLGVREVPGNANNKQIQAYHAGARRKGSSLAGMPDHESEGVSVLGPKAPDSTDWCASSGSWCMYQAMLRLRA